MTRWKMSTTQKPGASRKWASPSSVKETELNHKARRGKWGWCQGLWGEVNSLGRLELWEGADIASPAGKPQELLEPVTRAGPIQQLDLWRTDCGAISVQVKQRSPAPREGHSLGREMHLESPEFQIEL